MIKTGKTILEAREKKASAKPNGQKYHLSAFVTYDQLKTKIL
jgi:hypothetical protein